jgi:hypothetical protein
VSERTSEDWKHQKEEIEKNNFEHEKFLLHFCGFGVAIDIKFTFSVVSLFSARLAPIDR